MRVWEHIQDLEGQQLTTLDREKPFVVRAVDDEELTIYLLSSKKERQIGRSEIEGPFNDLWLSKKLTLGGIRDMHSRSNSAYIAALLARVPGIAHSLGPIRIWLEREDS